AELRESEERFRAAFEHAPIGIAILGVDGVWIDTNRALGDMLGRTTADLLDRPPFDLRHLARQEDDEGGDQLTELLTGTRRSFTVERRLFTSVARSVWASISVSLVHDPGGAPLHLICQVEDVTERKAAEESLSARVAFLAYHD